MIGRKETVLFAGTLKNQYAMRVPVYFKLILAILSLVVLGGTNDTLLAKYQFVFIGAYILMAILSGSTIRLGSNEKVLLVLMFAAWAIVPIESLYALEGKLTWRINIYFAISFLCVLCCMRTNVYACFFSYIRYSVVALAISIILSALLRERFTQLFSFWFTNNQRIQLDIRYGQFSGLIGDRSFAALAMCTGLSAELTHVIVKQNLRGIDLLCILICLTAMFLSGKRIVIFMLATGLFILWFFIHEKRTRRITLRLFGVLTVLALAALIVFPQTNVLMTRFLLGSKDATFNDRLHFWQTALDMFKQKPFFGWGIGSYLQYNLQFGNGIHQYAHNMYLQLLAERGIVGLTMFMLIFVGVLVLTIQTIKSLLRTSAQEDNEQLRVWKELCLFSLLLQIGFLIYGLTGYPIYNLQQSFLYAMCIAMVIGVRTEVGRKST